MINKTTLPGAGPGQKPPRSDAASVPHGEAEPPLVGGEMVEGKIELAAFAWQVHQLLQLEPSRTTLTYRKRNVRHPGP